MFGCFLTTPKKDLQNDQPHTSTDSRICNIESRPVEGEKIEVEEIDHLPKPKAVDQVSNGPGQNQGEGEIKNILIISRFEKEEEDDPDGQQRENEEEGRTKPSFQSSQHPKSSPWVSHMGEI